MTDASNRATGVNGYRAHALDDNSRYALWLGKPVGLKLATRRRTSGAELFSAR
jgi:hypothetical protein